MFMRQGGCTRRDPEMWGEAGSWPKFMTLGGEAEDGGNFSKINLKIKWTSLGGFPGSSDDKESACNAGDLGSVRGMGRSPGGGHGNPLQYSCLENPDGQKSLVEYSLWAHKESDTTDS